MVLSSANGGRAFQLIAGHPALDLINTLDWRFRDREPEELLESYSNLLNFTTQAGLLTPRQARYLLRNASAGAAARTLAAVRELREAAAAVFYPALDGQSPSAPAIKILEKFFKAARENQKLSWADAQLAWDQPNAAATADLPLWLLAQNTAGLMTSSAMQHVRACGSPDCRWLFLDTSKNHTRRWCDMRLCGNRMKARRFKAQHHA